ncbi:MAG TPA: hypothetical protein VF389_11740 [Woeseiaceae bacterium]
MTARLSMFWFAARIAIRQWLHERKLRKQRELVRHIGEIASAVGRHLREHGEDQRKEAIEREYELYDGGAAFWLDPRRWGGEWPRKDPVMEEAAQAAALWRDDVEQSAMRAQALQNMMMQQQILANQQSHRNLMFDQLNQYQRGLVGGIAGGLFGGWP